MLPLLLLMVHDPSNLLNEDGSGNGAATTGGSSSMDASESSLMDGLWEHQLFVIVGGVVLVHVLLIGFLMAALYKQTPKKFTYKKNE